MLAELSVIGKWYKNEPSAAWSFGENLLTEDVREALSRLGMDFEFYGSTARINTGANHCYIPSQYLLYAVKIKPFALLLRRYLDVFEELKSSEALDEVIKKLQLLSTEESEITKNIDSYSKDNFFGIFNDQDARLSAKTIFKFKSKKIEGLRSGDDFYQSILMTILPVPNVSSDILGRIVSALSKQPDIYDILEQSYSTALPFFISSRTGDEMLQRLFFILSIKDNLAVFLDGRSERIVSYQGIKDLFLLTETPLAGNQSYFEPPVTYLEDKRKFVHLKKGLLDSPEKLKTVNNFLLDIYKNLEIREISSGYILCDRLRSEEKVKDLYPDSVQAHYTVGDNSKADGVPRVKYGVNRIYYGAPGTGKSYSINQIAKGHRVYRTVFHPDTQYVDFVGGLKPSMGQDGVEYTFRPGPFTTAYINALNSPDSQVFLIIEELNRAAAAAVFGELFQLLDRNKDGDSIYSIDISDPDMQQYIDTLTKRENCRKLRLPSNLSILASMNSSDQAVMPMDTAFKRRWLFEYLPINYNEATLGSFTINLSGNRVVEIDWKNFAEIINERLTALEVPEDRLLGHRFLSEQELTKESSALALKGKLLVYLWDDVLRHGKRPQVFTTSVAGKVIGTFGQLAYEFDAGRPVFSEAIEEKLVDKGRLISELALSVQTEDHVE